MSVKTFRRKPTARERSDQLAAQYVPGEPLDGLHAVATEADGFEESETHELIEIQTRKGPALLVLWTRYPDDGPRKPEFELVRAGQWLAWSPDSDFLYTTDDANWRQFYDEVTP